MKKMINNKYIIIFFIIISSCLFSELTFAAFTSSTQPGAAFDVVAGVATWPIGNNDDGAEVVNIGFTFDLQGTNYTQVRLITNGALHFGADQNFHTQWGNGALATGTADRLLLPFWDDLNPGAGGTVRYGTLGTAPNRRFVAHWDQVERYNNAAATCSFQVVLFEGSNDIHFRYDPADTGTNCDGRSATIGAEETDANFDQFSFNTAINLNNDIIYTQPNSYTDWHLDGPTWTGAVNEVLDSSGNNYHGTALGGVSPVTGKVCNAADLSANSTTDYVSMNNNTLNGLTNFTISFWVNTTNTGNQAALSGANGGSSNEVLAWFPNNTTFRPFVKNAGLSNITIPNIADGNWHHIAWVRNGTNNCVAVDGAAAGCSATAGSTAALNISAGGLIIGQEQDSVGGSFDISQEWEGLIDEVMIFQRAFSLAEVTAVYNNQNAGNNWDGSARTCPANTPTMEVGSINLIDTTVTPTLTSVSFKQTYTIAPLIFILPDNGGADPATVRVRNVTTTGFNVSQIEPDNLDGPHPAMTVHYMAIQPGAGPGPWVFNLPDGRLVEVGTHSTQTLQHGGGGPPTEGWDTINFTSTFTAPAVLADIQSAANETGTPPTTTSTPWMTVAMRNITAASVQVALERAEVSSGTISSNETIAYAVIEGDVQGSFASGSATILYESITTLDNIDGWQNENCAGDVGQAVPFINAYSDTPLVVGNQSRRDGGDGGWLRRCSLTTTQVGLAIDEDQFANPERNHTNEAASLLVFSEAFCLPTECPSLTVDHYAISFPVTPAVTCEALEVHIEAHADATDHAQIATPLAGTVITVTANVATAADVVWQEGAGGNGSLVAGPLAGQAQYTFDGIETSVELFMRYPNVEAGVSVNVTDGTASDTEATEDPTVDFVLAAFRFLDNADGDIGTQIAGKPSNIAPGIQTLQLRAVQTNTTTLECEAALNGAGIPVELAYQCNDPSTCAITNNGASITAAATTDIDDVVGVGYTSLNMNFSPAGIAEFSFIYDDAGDISLLAQKAIAADPSATPPTTAFTIQGTSAPFVVRPFGFDVQVTGNPAASSAAGTKFTTAGEDFTVTVRAVAWNSTGDADNDGVPDFHADTNPSNNTDLSSTVTFPTTPNFGQEGTNEDIDLSGLLNLPNPGNDPGLSGGTSITTITSGSGNSTTVNYNEVGIIEITAQVAVDNDYLGAGAVMGKSGYVGRFVPYVFEVTSNTPEFGTACGTFGYIGQSFTYVTVPVISLTAKAKGTAPAYGSTTQNYTGLFLKLTDAKFQASGNRTYATDAAVGTLDLGNVLVPAVLPADPVIADTGSGTATLTFSDGGGIAFDRGAPEVPFDADIALSINVIDEDNVFYGDGNGVDQNPWSFGTATLGNGIAFDVDKEQRWGRLVLDNAFGSELLPLEIAIRTEYFTVGDFIASTDPVTPANGDNCTTYTSANISYTNLTGLSANPVATGAGTLVNGKDDDANPLVLTNAAPQNTGYVDVTHSTDSWLQYDWDNDTNHDNDPFARATWGIFAGPDEFIYIREPW